MFLVFDFLFIKSSGPSWVHIVSLNSPSSLIDGGQSAVLSIFMESVEI